MTLRCDRCDAPLPALAPGFSLSTCRQCGAMSHVNASRSASTPTNGRTRSVPPTLRLEEQKDLWRIGWDNTSLTPLLFPAVWIGLIVMMPIRIPGFLKLLQEPVPAVLVGAMTLLVAYVGVASAINITWMEVRGQELSIVTRPLWLPRSAIVDTRTLLGAFCHTYQHKVPRTEIIDIRHCVSVRTKDAKVIRLVENLPHEQDAVWLTTFLSERLGIEDGGRP